MKQSQKVYNIFVILLLLFASSFLCGIRGRYRDDQRLCLRPLANGEKKGSAFTADEFMKWHRGTVLKLAGIWARATGEGAAEDCLGNVYEVLLDIEKNTYKDVDMDRIGVATYVSRYVLNVMRNELRANMRRQHREQLSLEAVRTKFLTNRKPVEEEVNLRLDYEVFLTSLTPRENSMLSW